MQACHRHPRCSLLAHVMHDHSEQVETGTRMSEGWAYEPYRHPACGLLAVVTHGHSARKRRKISGR